MWIDRVDLAGFDQRRDDAPVSGPGIMTCEERVFAVQGDGANGAFDGVIIDLDATVGPAPVLFRSRAHVRRPFVRRPLVISSRGLNVSGAGCRSR